MRGLLYADTPAPAPSKGPKPHRTMLAVTVAILIERKPRIGLHAGAASAAFQYLHARVHRLLGELPLTGPAPRQVSQPIAIPLREIPRRRLRTLQHHRFVRTILNSDFPAQHARLRVHGVMQMDQQGTLDILE